MSSPKPIEIKRTVSDNESAQQGTGIVITWSDANEYFLPAELLRKECPCASCQEARGDTTHATPLSPKGSRLRVLRSTLDEQTDLQKVTLIGNYAIGIVWGDKHDSGIYTYSFLYDLCRQKEAKSSNGS